MKNELEIISSGCFIDEGYKVEVWTVRLFGKLKYDYYDAQILNSIDSYEDDIDYEEYLQEKKDMQDKAIDNIKSALPIKGEISYTVKKVLSEIFTVIAFYAITTAGSVAAIGEVVE